VRGRRDRCRGREGQNSNSTANCERDGDGRSAGSGMAAKCARGSRGRARARRVDTVGQGWSRALRQFRESLVRAGWTWRTATLSSLFLITLLCAWDKSARGSARQGARGREREDIRGLPQSRMCSPAHFLMPTTPRRASACGVSHPRSRRPCRR